MVEGTREDEEGKRKEEGREEGNLLVRSDRDASDRQFSYHSAAVRVVGEGNSPKSQVDYFGIEAMKRRPDMLGPEIISNGHNFTLVDRDCVILDGHCDCEKIQGVLNCKYNPF